MEEMQQKFGRASVLGYRTKVYWGYGKMGEHGGVTGAWLYSFGLFLGMEMLLLVYTN